MGCRPQRVDTLLRGRTLPGSDAEQISILSWNVLAPGHEDTVSVDWEERLACLLENLGLYAACDILCLQELEKGVSLEPVQSYLAERGFECVAQKREGKNSYRVVNATFFRADRLRLHWSESHSRVLLSGLLLPNGREVCVVNVHLAADGAVAAQVSQMASSLQKMQRLVSSYRIICGDFNDGLGAKSPLVPMLAAHGVWRSAPCGATHEYGGHLNTLDHICVGPGLVQELVLTSTPKDLGEMRRRHLPDRENPSDHLPVAGLFRMKASDWQMPRLPAPPATPDLEMWRELCMQDLRPLPTDKKARKERRKEQQQLEETLLSGLDDRERGCLLAWREETQTAAKTLCALVFDNCLATVRARDTAAT